MLSRSMAPVTTPTPAPIAAPRPAPLPPPIMPPMIAPAIPPWTPRSITCAEAGFGAVTWLIANAAANIAPSPAALTVLLFMLRLLSHREACDRGMPDPRPALRIRHSATSNVEPERQANRRSWQGNGATLLQHVIAALDRGPFRDRELPPFHIGVIGEVHRLPAEAGDPRPAGDV